MSRQAKLNRWCFELGPELPDNDDGLDYGDLDDAAETIQRIQRRAASALGDADD